MIICPNLTNLVDDRPTTVRQLSSFQLLYILVMYGKQAIIERNIGLIKPRSADSDWTCVFRLEPKITHWAITALCRLEKKKAI